MTATWVNDGSGSFTRGKDIGDRGISPSFGDLDNDGDVDLWLGRAGPDMFFENDGKGSFTLNERLSMKKEDLATTCARLIDVDSDGDLDFLSFRIASGSIPLEGDFSPAAKRI